MVIVSSFSVVFIVTSSSTSRRFMPGYQSLLLLLTNFHKVKTPESGIRVEGVPKDRRVRTRDVFGHLWHFYLFCES